MADISLNESDEVTIADAAGINKLVVNLDGSTNHRIVDAVTPSQIAKVDSQGRLLVFIPPTSSTIPIQLVYYSATSIPINSNEWQDLILYTVPANYNLHIIQFQIVSSQGSDEARLIKRTVFGTYNSGTNVFTDGSAITAPAFASSLFARVTTQTGNVNNDTITITYTNQDGVTGRTGTVVVNKNTVVGSNPQVTLQAGDYGIIDVTAINHSAAGQTGQFSIEGTVSIVYETAGVANTMAEGIFALNAAVIPAGSSVVLQYQTSAAGAKIRRISAGSTLVPLT